MSTVQLADGPAAQADERAMTIGDLRPSAYILLALCLGALCWLYAPVFRWWYKEWMAEESYYSHGILVPAISIFLAWLKRNQLAEIAIKAYPRGYLILVPTLLLVVALFWAGGGSVQGLLFPVVVGSLILVLFGPGMLRAAGFPVGYLYFMCVLPGDILTRMSFPIQMMSTHGATLILRALTFDANQDGARIILPSIRVLVGSPCSGFRLLISLFALTMLFVFLTEGPRWGKAALIALTLPLSLLLNSIRITMIALVGEFQGSEAMHTFHDYSGYIMLVLAFIALFYLARLVKCQKFNSMLA